VLFSWSSWVTFRIVVLVSDDCCLDSLLAQAHSGLPRYTPVYTPTSSGSLSHGSVLNAVCSGSTAEMDFGRISSVEREHRLYAVSTYLLLFSIELALYYISISRMTPGSISAQVLLRWHRHYLGYSSLGHLYVQTWLISPNCRAELEGWRRYGAAACTEYNISNPSLLRVFVNSTRDVSLGMFKHISQNWDILCSSLKLGCLL
jgi:hypothetical protein